jgi:hypothetical protein
MKPQTKFIIVSNSVIPIVIINDAYYVPAGEVFELKDNNVYDNKLDAQYTLLIQNLKKGKQLSNYKTSKYFKYYIDRIKDENPEYLI